MGANTEFHFGVSVNDMDPISRTVYEGLCNGVNKKELSNKYKMPITTINAISKRFRTGQKQAVIIPAVQIYDNISTKNNNDGEREKMNDIVIALFDMSKKEDDVINMIYALNDIFSGKSNESIMKRRLLTQKQMDTIIKLKSAINLAKNSTDEKSEIILSEKDRNVVRSWMIDNCDNKALFYNASTKSIEWVGDNEEQLVDQDKSKNTNRRRRKRLTEEEIDTIIELLTDPSNKITDIANMAEVSISTISRLKSLYADEINERKILNNEQQNEECVIEPSVDIVDINTCNEDITDLQPVNVNSTVRVGLVAERHPMPVDDFIFKNRISSNLMFDYARLERMCREYIEDTIDFDENGCGKQTLVVYVTGIQCVLSSLIKVTNEMKVNLILRHYNSDTNSYARHVIWNQFGSSNIPDEICKLFTNTTNSYVFNCTIDELYNNKSLVKISKVYYRDVAYKNIDHIDTILTKNIDDAFYLMKNHIEKANEKDQKMIIFAKGYKMHNGSYYEDGFDIKLQTK